MDWGLVGVGVVQMVVWWNMAVLTHRWMRGDTPTRVFLPWFALGMTAFVGFGFAQDRIREAATIKPGVWYCVDAECCVEAQVREDGGMAFHQDASKCGVGK